MKIAAFSLGVLLLLPIAAGGKIAGHGKQTPASTTAPANTIKKMTQPISTKTAEHYTWGNPAIPCDGWYLVQTDDLSVIEERMPPGTFEERHVHKKSRQFFYVLAGELTMEADGAEHVVRQGEGIEIAPGVAHQAMNHGKSDLRILVTSQPPSHADRQPS